MILIPVLVSVLGVDVKSAIAASLVAVVTTSGAAALIRGRDSMSNYRVGVTLEVAAGLGAIAGAVLATLAPGDVLTMLFGVSLLATGALSWRAVDDTERVLPQTWWGRVLQLDGVEETKTGIKMTPPPRPSMAPKQPLTMLTAIIILNRREAIRCKKISAR